MSLFRVTTFPTLFRVRSPGGFPPPGITLQNFLDDSKPRSPILAEAFKRAGIVDRAGRGIREMYGQLLRTGRGVPDYSATNNSAVIVQIGTSDANLEMGNRRLTCGFTWWSQGDWNP